MISDSESRDRSNTPCYWLTQPGGCSKGDACPYLHASEAVSKPVSYVRPLAELPPSDTLSKLAARPKNRAVEDKAKALLASASLSSSLSSRLGQRAIAALGTAPRHSAASSSAQSSTANNKSSHSTDTLKNNDKNNKATLNNNKNTIANKATINNNNNNNNKKKLPNHRKHLSQHLVATKLPNVAPNAKRKSANFVNCKNNLNDNWKKNVLPL